MRKSLSLILALVMLIGMVLVTVFATEAEHTHSYENGICTGCGEEEPNPYAGKTIACIGDSITAAYGVTKDETDYVTLLAKKLGMNYIRLGVSGTTLCTDGSRTCNIGKLTESNLNGADVVTIAMGINDFCAAGTGYYELGDIHSTDTSTIYGAVRMWCERIEELRKTDSLRDTQFYFLTPVITSWNNSVTSARNWDQSKTNIHGYTLRDLCNAIIEVCALYDVGVIDLNLLSGMYYVDAQDNNISVFGGDGVHPGAVGHQMMAEAIEDRLLERHLRNDHDHSYGSWVTTTYPDCEGGEQQRVCAVCTATESKKLDGKGHTYAAFVTAPTCTEKGYTALICEVCGDSKLDTLTLDITELFDWTYGKMIIATTGACQDYAYWQASDYVDVSSFDSIQILTADTIYATTTAGFAFYDAGKNYISGVTHTDGVGQEYGTLLHIVEVPENAVYVRTTWYAESHPNYSSAFGDFSCMVTGQYVPATGHSYQMVSAVSPTCTAQGSFVYTCYDCGDSYTESVNRAEHTYDDGACTICGVSVLGSEWLVPDFAEGDYTMVVLPDTQNLVTYWPEIYYNQMQWIADNKDTLNIQAVLHMGDMVNNNNAMEWAACETGTDIIDAAGIPWMPMRGNHDDSTWFNMYYDYATYGENQSWFGGSYEEGMLDHTYWFVTAGGHEYVILSLGWAPSWDALSWAQEVVQAHDDKRVILVCHAYMNKDGTLLDSGDAYCVTTWLPGYPNGDDVWNAFKDYGNVVLAMGGHIHSADLVTWVGQNGAGQDVTSLLVDRQDDDTTNRYAMVALLTFHADSNTVDVNWYSTRYDALFRAKNQFSITVPDVCGHSYTSAIVKPTCTENGGMKYICTICGHSYWENRESALGHSYKNNICTTCGILRIDLTDQFTDWTEGGPVLFRNGYGYGEEGFPDGSNPNLKYSGYISVEGMDTLELTVCARKGHSATGGYAFYTDKGVVYFISEGASTRNGNGASAEGTVVHTITVPEGAKYIRVSYWVDSTSYAVAVPFSCVGYQEGCLHTYENGICTGCGAVLGDLDLDGDVDAQDLTILARHVAGIEVLNDEVILANADVNGNGVVDAEDLTHMARYVAGIVTDWEEASP